MIRGARFVRRRRLLRAAAVGGMAYQAGKHIDPKRHDAPETPAPAPGPVRDMPSKLKMLDELEGCTSAGCSPTQEFAQQKQRVLEG